MLKLVHYVARVSVHKWVLAFYWNTFLSKEIYAQKRSEYIAVLFDLFC